MTTGSLVSPPAAAAAKAILGQIINATSNREMAPDKRQCRMLLIYYLLSRIGLDGSDHLIIMWTRSITLFIMARENSFHSKITRFYKTD
jgi:hypothetical protein